jgi:uncharacterized repeat protein (TIGR02543 family)
MRKNPPFGLILGVPANVNTKYVYGSGVGALNTSVRRYLKKRASFTCCSANVTTTPLVPTTYTVSYNNGNGSTFGNVPGSSTYTNGATVTVSGNTGTLTRTGYTFAGWNTLGGTGPNYNPGDTFTISANVTFYAQWTPVVPPPPSTYNVSYNANGSSTSGSVPGSSTYTNGATVTVSGNTGTLTRTGYTFAGWNTLNNTGPNYNPGDTFTISANVAFYAQWAPNPTTYTVSYNNNGGSGTLTDFSSPYTAGSNVTVLGNTFSRYGYTFAGWSTNSSGTGSDYNGGDTFIINANTILYAQWIPIPPPPQISYTLTYNGNGGVGSEPALTTEYSGGTSVTILSNSGSPVLSKLGYGFAGWNTLADGSGTNYVGGDGDTFAINANTTLYANWIIGGTRLYYNPGTGGSGTAPSRSGTFYTAFSTQPVVDKGSFTNINGYIFSGWNTLANGTGTSYPVGSNIIMPGAGVVSLHAQWIDTSLPQVTLTYDAGSGSGTPPAPVADYGSKSTATILGNTGYTNGSLVFYEWNTAANGTGTSYQAGSTRTMTANTILYAQWVSNTSTYTVTYVANGATSGSVPAITTYPSGVQVPILGQGSLTRPGYTFLGWNSSSTGAGSAYVPGYTFTSKTATLYALWAPGSTIKNCGGGTTSGGSGSAIITYSFPYAQIIKSSDTITIYTAALLGTFLGPSTSNYGSGAAPFGIISIASKTVITQTTIEINVNTSYSNPADDYNYPQTITNGTGVTYWPPGATISSITYSTQQLSNTSTPTYSISTTNTVNGCGLTASSSSISGTTTTYSFFNQSFTINFSDSTSTFIATSPNNAFYASSNALPTPTWAPTVPRTSYPYAEIVPKAHNALTTITIIPSTGSKYVSPSLPLCTIEYNGNGNTSGTQPIPQYMAPYISGTTSITLRTNSGNLQKSGFTFSGWNTAADGSGISYALSASYGGGQSLTLYAKWL